MARIKTFGPVDERSLKQLERCMAAGDAEFGVLCADHHPGYSQPIGGGIAYEGYVSPSGVGYDIGCIAAGTPVLTTDGCHLPIEAVHGEHRASCWDGVRVRRIDPLLGAVARGPRQTLVVRLANGRSLTLTPEHEVRTKLGWRRADGLARGDAVACTPTLGRPFEPVDGELPIPLPSRREELHRHGLWPLRLDDERLPALLRLLGFVSGDGHLTRDGKNVSAYVFDEEDALAIRTDFERLGFPPRVYRRLRRGCTKPEIHVRVGSVALHSLLAAAGSPVGKKRWEQRPLPWLFYLPAWLRGQFVSAFASAEMSTPRVVEGRIANLAIKRTGTAPHAAAFVARLLASLGFRVSMAPSGPARGSRVTQVVQLLGGEDGQIRFLEEIGFCYSAERRVAAAAALSVAWQRQAALRVRAEAVALARRAYDRGGSPLAIARHLAESHGVSKAFVHHAVYSRRPSVRTAKGAQFGSDHSGEIAWVAVEDVVAGPDVEVFDLATADPAESFVANGVVVHNCGNKAARTELTRADLDARGGVEQIMGEITRRISFGMGVPAQERVDHPVLDKIRRAEFAPQRKLAQLAESQLGTVGSGNHYVNLMEDEEGRLWVGVHFGSRGFGHKTASGFLALAQGLPFEGRAREGEMDSPPVLFPADSELGQSYVAAMELAGEYAYAGRDVVVGKALEILGAEATHEVHNHHNFGFRESHFGRDYWVIRKGCTPARPGQEGFVGGSMGDESVILEGVESAENEEALYSTVHGAGRVMSRSQAAGRVRRRKRWACRDRGCPRVFEQADATCPDHPGAGVSKVWVEEQVKPGAVDWPAVQARLRAQGIVLVGGGADEAPEVYKRLPDVLAAHGDTVRVKHRLRPLGVAMAGREVHDPYKD